MSKVKLSFCIPTYNRKACLEELIREILVNKNNEIEVVVLDNFSEDGTSEMLSNINDRRLKVFQNPKNMGSLYNIVNVLTKAIGEYVIFTTDKDHVNHKKINNFLNFLDRNKDLACGFCQPDPLGKDLEQKYKTRFEVLKNIAYQGYHPTGYFFRKDILSTLNISTRFVDSNFVGLFPLEFILAEMSLYGNAAIYKSDLFVLEAEKDAANNKSLSINGNSESAYFQPKQRLRLAINFSNHLETLGLLSKDKIKIKADIFKRGLRDSTIGYKAILMNENICLHHHMKSRDVGFKEIFLNGVFFYSEYMKKTINNNKDFLLLNKVLLGMILKFTILKLYRKV